MNKKNNIFGFLKQLQWWIIKSSQQPNSPKQKAFALVTKPPHNIPIGKAIYLGSLKVNSLEYLLQIDILPVKNVSNWFFIIRYIS